MSAPSTGPESSNAAAEPVVAVHDAFCLHPLPDGAVVALRGLTLRVMPGERVVVHGPNGSGKTTLLRLLPGEPRRAAGRAVVAGFDVGGSSAAAVARWRCRQLGWVDQRASCTLRPELDVLANVGLQQRLGGVARSVARQRSVEWLERLDLGHLSDRRPAELSGGEAQRVAVAAALAHGPTLVLADEPSGELDLASADKVYDAIVDAVAAAGASLVLVSHDRRAARVADRVVRIRDGRLSETWTPRETEELLVVDERGWVRLPERARRAGGVGPLRVVADDDTITLAGHDVGPAPLVGADAFAVLASDVRPPLPPVAPVAPGEPAERAAPVAELRQVTKAYGGRPVLVAFDLTITAGRLHVLSGRSGSGKSTLLRILVGLDRPDAGEVLVDGVPLGALDRAALAAVRRRFAAVVAQDVHLAETVGVADNVELARAARALPRRADIDARWLDALGLTALAGRTARVLSGGERQRTAVARALATGARLIVLDEPSSQLDEGAVELLVAALRAAVDDGAAVVVATHDPTLVAAADTVASLDG